MTEEDYDDYEDDGDEEEKDSMVLCFNNGKPEIKMASDLQRQQNNQQELITEFIRENLDLFKSFLDKKGLTEADFNNGNKGENEE